MFDVLGIPKEEKKDAPENPDGDCCAVTAADGRRGRGKTPPGGKSASRPVPPPVPTEPDVYDKDRMACYAGHKIPIEDRTLKLEDIRKLLEKDFPELSQERTEMIYDDKTGNIVPVVKGAKKGTAVATRIERIDPGDVQAGPNVLAVRCDGIPMAIVARDEIEERFDSADLEDALNIVLRESRLVYVGVVPRLRPRYVRAHFLNLMVIVSGHSTLGEEALQFIIESSALIRAWADPAEEQED